MTDPHTELTAAAARAAIRDVPDFPKPGILFRDITPLLADAAAYRESIRRMAAPFRDRQIDVIVAAEARAQVRHGNLRALLFAQGYHVDQFVGVPA